MDDLSNTRPEVNFNKWDELILNPARGSQEILKLIVESRENGSMIGISSKALGEGFFITAIEEIIIDEGEATILIKPYDVTGFILPTSKLTLAQIDAACPLMSEFKNPVLKNFEKDKSWFF
jgi:hypothetical protein